MAQNIHVQILHIQCTQTEICPWSPPSAKVKKNMYGVKFTHVSKSIPILTCKSQ